MCSLLSKYLVPLVSFSYFSDCINAIKQGRLLRYSQSSRLAKGLWVNSWFPIGFGFVLASHFLLSQWFSSGVRLVWGRGPGKRYSGASLQKYFKRFCLEINKTNCFKSGKSWETFTRIFPGHVTKCIRLIPNSLVVYLVYRLWRWPCA